MAVEHLPGSGRRCGARRHLVRKGAAGAGVQPRAGRAGGRAGVVFRGPPGGGARGVGDGGSHTGGGSGERVVLRCGTRGAFVRRPLRARGG